MKCLTCAVTKVQFVICWMVLLLTACASLSSTPFTGPPTLVTEPPPASAYESLAAVTDVTIPDRDLADLAARFNDVEASRVAQSEPTPYQVGDVVTFWSKNLNRDDNVQIEARLVYRSHALNMWVQTGETVDAAQVKAAARRIEDEILPTNRSFFGQEWRPGIDGDDRINILHVSKIGGVGAAYFWSGDEYVTAVNPYSNQREMLYVSLADAAIGSQTYYATIAHEMEHLIQWHTDKNEDAWLGEGLAELAAHVNGLKTVGADGYINQTDIQLNTLSQDSDVVAAHYSAATLFAVYFLDRFGPEATQTLVRHPQNGVTGVSQTLAELGTGLRFDDLFADWLVANYLAGTNRGQGVYQYASLEMPALKPTTMSQRPTTTTVHQYGADYIRWRGQEPVTVIFTGTQQVKVVDTTPHSGRYFWMSYPADGSDMSLTRRFDLTGLAQATLTFWTWYEIEAGWDYGYVAVSRDDGRTWQLLETEQSTRHDPQGNSLGPGFTGNSGGGQRPVWIRVRADLTPFTGQPVLIRFQYLTDDAVHHQGFVIDNIAVPELKYSDDVETGDGGWTAAGFVRTTNVLPQRFIVQRILVAENDIRVDRLQLDENQRGQWQFPMDKEVREAILIVAGNTPVTRQTAVYAYQAAYQVRQ